MKGYKRKKRKIAGKTKRTGKFQARGAIDQIPALKLEGNDL